MDQYIYLRVGQRRWHRKLFGRRHPELVNSTPRPVSFRLDEADTTHLFEWCKNYVKDLNIEDQKADNDTPRTYSCSLTKHECEGFLEECEKLLKQRSGAENTEPSETAERLCQNFRMLIDDLKRCINGTNWLTSSCLITVENSGGIIMD